MIENLSYATENLHHKCINNHTVIISLKPEFKHKSNLKVNRIPTPTRRLAFQNVYEPANKQDIKNFTEGMLAEIDSIWNIFLFYSKSLTASQGRLLPENATLLIRRAQGE